MQIVAFAHRLSLTVRVRAPSDKLYGGITAVPHIKGIRSIRLAFIQKIVIRRLKAQTQSLL